MDQTTRSLSASEARELMPQDLSDIFSEIRKEAVRGSFLIGIFKPLNEVTIKKLENLGYKVTEINDSHNPTLKYTISWKTQ